MEWTKTRSVGSFVADDYRAASVFQKYGIDFCCRGGVSIDEVSTLHNLDTEKLLSELKEATSTSDNAQTDFKTWPLDLLADYIEKKHHRYIEKAVPVLKEYLDKICEVHGYNHPELLKVREEFLSSAANLAAHMQKEEMILFPSIRKMVAAEDNKETYMRPGFGTVMNPIQMMMKEHDAEGERFRTIVSLTHDYTTPEDACRTYQVTFSLLKEFESDLHKHIHLENNILFPKAVELEKKFAV